MKMFMTTLMITLAAVLVATPAAFGQEADPAGAVVDAYGGHATTPDVSPPTFTADQLVLRYYSPQVADSRSVASVMERFYRRDFYVKAEDGSVSGPVRNIQSFGESVMIYDTPEFVERVLEAMRSLEEATTRDPNNPAGSRPTELAVVEYSPRYQPVNNLYRLLDPFRKDIVVGFLDTHPRGTQAQIARNITVLEEPATLVLRDTPEAVEEMVGMLKRMDQPAPQVLISVWLLRGSHEPQQGQLPDDLVRNLSNLVPFPGFTRESIGVLRSSVIAGQAMTILGDMDDDRFLLKLIPGGYDVDARQLAITDCEFNAGQQGFSTSTVVSAGEYTVLGATGSNPVFVVLQVSPLDS
jgi:hypothetical protein